MPRVLGYMRRLATLLGALILLGAGGTLVLLALTLVPPMQSVLPGITVTANMAELDIWVRMAWLAMGMAGVLSGMVLLVASFARLHGHEPWILLQRRSGRTAGNSTVSISRRAVHALAAHAAERVDGVLDSQPRLHLTGKGWVMVCEVLVHRERRPLTEVLADVDRTLRKALEEQTGFGVRRLDVRGRFEPFDPRQRVI